MAQLGVPPDRDSGAVRRAKLGGQPPIDELRRRRVRALVGVEADRDIELRRVVPLERAEVVARFDRNDGHVMDGRPRHAERAATVAWASRPSAAAIAAMCAGHPARPAAVASTTCTCLRNVSTRSALANRAVRAVGSTWFGPAT